MSVIVKPIETGAPMGSGPYLPHVIGDVDLWQHIWHMEVLRGVTAEGATPGSVPRRTLPHCQPCRQGCTVR